MIFILILFLFLGFLVFYMVKKNSKFHQKIFNLRFTGVMVGSSIVYFFLSYIIFGVLFALGEGGATNSTAFLNNILSSLSLVVMPVVSLVGYLDKLYYSNAGHGFPNFIYFPISFILNSLLMGFFIAVLLVRFRSKK